MKKSLKIVCIFLIFAVVVASVIFIWMKNKSLINEIESNKVTYLATIKNFSVLDNDDEYEIVKDKNRLNIIFDQIQVVSNNNISSIYDDNFFATQNLLIIVAGQNSELKKINVTNKKIAAKIYKATPEVAVDKEYEYDLYIIPVEKSVNDVKLNISPYPFMMY